MPGILRLQGRAQAGASSRPWRVPDWIWLAAGFSRRSSGQRSVPSGSFAGVQIDGSLPINVEGLPPPGAVWPSEALQLLDLAESRARAGDWQGFGEALDELRALLVRLQGGA